MNGSFLAVGRYRFRTTLDGQWLGLLSIVLLVALLGGLAMGAVAGARRTQAAYPSYLVRSHASDLDVTIYLNGGADPRDSYSGRLTDEIEHLPEVTQTGISFTLYVLPLTAKGLPSDVPAIDDGQVIPVGSFNGVFFDQDQPAVQTGRLADPDRADQFLATASAARALGWHVGEHFTFGTYTFAQFNSPAFGTEAVRPARVFGATLVGIVVPNDQVVTDDLDRNLTQLILTPAITRSLFAQHLAAAFPTYQLRLGGGSPDVPAVERAIIALLPPHAVYSFHVTSVVTAQVESATKPESIALGVFGIIAALAALLLAGMAIGRTASARRVDLECSGPSAAPRARRSSMPSWRRSRRCSWPPSSPWRSQSRCRRSRPSARSGRWTHRPASRSTGPSSASGGPSW